MAYDSDIIVIGGGPVGLSAAYNAAKAGKSVHVLERFNLFNQSGSSNDLVRMYRTMYTEDFMADLAFDSLKIWDELETDAGLSLRWMTGLLNFGDPNYKSGPEGTLKAPIKNLKRLGLRYKELTAKQIMETYPFRGLPSTFEGIFAYDDGCINVPSLLRTLYRLAVAHGTVVTTHARVSGIEVDASSVTVGYTKDGEEKELTAQKCIIAAGAFTNDVVGSVSLDLNLELWEMVYEYYATNPGPGGTVFPSMWFQFKEPTDGNPALSNLFYGFPTVPWGPPNVARIAVDNAVNVVRNPAERTISPSANDLTITAEFVAEYCIGVDDRPNYAGTCLQTNVPDNMYVLDFLPESVGAGHKNVALFTAGWGMKLVPLIGRILAQLVVDGKTPYDISHFKIDRPGVLTGTAPSMASAMARAGSDAH
ncbi:MAG: FAD-dependent oxidoreductase [Chloroflexi bacterium]|nr:FAD-dependent oxidoreductase [Chloroflexota bacterium]